MSSSSSSHIPWEIMVDILSRLPAKSLVRFRCVSTSWLRLIDSSDFVKSHLHQSIENNTDISLFFANGSNRWMSVDVASLVNNINVRPRVHHEVPNKHTIRGSCNGLVCLSSFEFRNPSLVLWNPTTRKLRKLPQKSTSGSFRETYGFGYDRVNNDYKVVRMITAAGDSTANKCADQVDVYSLESNSWHIAQKPPRDVYFGHHNLHNGKLANGAIHWPDFGNHKSGEIYRIIAFDLVTEEYSFVSLSEYLKRDYPLSLKSFNGCLSIICMDLSRDVEFGVDIWVMKEYGVKESWTKLISLPDPLPVHLAVSLCPLVYSNERSEILVPDNCYENKLVWFSPKGKKMDRTVGIDGFTSLCDIDTCLGSLVSVNE